LRTQSKFRLLVVRLGAMGDILHALPAVTALRRAHPSWVIGWVVEPNWRHLLTTANGTPAEPLTASQPLVDQLHLAPVKSWAKSPLSAQTAREIKDLRLSLKSAEYDAVLELQGAVRSAILGSWTGACRRVGERSPREWVAKWLFTERVTTTGKHVIEQDVELASAVAGDALEPVQPLLPLDPHAEAWCDELFAPFGNEPVALLIPGAGWGSKRWPADRYAAVASSLTARGFRVLVNSAPGEENLSEAIKAQSNHDAVPVHCSLPQLIAINRRVALAVGGDTGPIHLACALGRPVVGIYGPTDPARNGPFGTRFRVLRSPFSQRNHARLDEPEAGLLTISPEAVLEAVDEVLAPEAAQ
jgi:heptosyltransferase-1